MSHSYCDSLGDWVKQRCDLRSGVYGKPMDPDVKTWLRGLGHPGTMDGFGDFPSAKPEVREWVISTITDPDWV